MGPEQTLPEAIATAVPRGATETAGTMVSGIGATTDPSRYMQNLAEMRDLVRTGRKGEALVQLSRGRLAGLQPFLMPYELEDPATAEQAFTRVQSQLDKMLTDVRGGQGKPLSANPLVSAGENIQQFAAGALPVEPQHEQNMAVQVARGVGSTLPYVATRLVPIAGPALLPVAAGAAGAGEAYQQAAAAGASDEDQARAALYGIIPGSTDILPIENLFRQAPLSPGFRGAVYGILKAAFQQGLVEGGQEAAQQAMQNVIARIIHTPQQEIAQGVAENGIVGFLVGTLFGGVGAGLHRGPQAQVPPEATQTPTQQTPPPGTAPAPADVTAFSPDVTTQPPTQGIPPAPAPQNVTTLQDGVTTPRTTLVPSEPPARATVDDLRDIMADERTVDELRQDEAKFEAWKQEALQPGTAVQVKRDGETLVGTVSGYSDMQGDHFYEVDLGGDNLELVPPVDVKESEGAPAAEGPSPSAEPVAAPPQAPPAEAAPPSPAATSPEAGWESFYRPAVDWVRQTQRDRPGETAIMVTPRRISEATGASPAQAKRIIQHMKGRGTLTMKGRTRQLTKPRGVIQIIKEMGGIQPSDETRARDLTTGAPGVVRRDGNNLNDIRVHMEELGLLPEGSTDDEVFRLIDNDIRGNQAGIYHPDDEEVLAQMQAREAQKEEKAREHAVDLHLDEEGASVTDQERAEIKRRVLEKGEPISYATEAVLSREVVTAVEQDLALNPQEEDIPFDVGPTKPASQVQPPVGPGGPVVARPRPESAERQAQAPPRERGQEGGLPAQKQPATERTDQGEQILVPGVRPVTDRERVEKQMEKPMQGGRKAPPAGGLFDEDARNQTDLLDAIKKAEKKPAQKAGRKMYRGYGRTDQRSVYNENALMPVLGPGEYWALDPKDARVFGPNVDERTVPEFKNPLVIRNDDQWRTFTKGANLEFPNPYAETEAKTTENVNKLHRTIQDFGFDGVEIRIDAVGDSDVNAQGERIKTLRNVFDMSQIFIPEKKAEKPKESRFGTSGKATGNEAAIAEAIKKVISDMAPRANLVIVDKMRGGAIGSFSPARNLISVSLGTGEEVEAARHEVIHFLKEAGLFTPQEWSVLERNAEKWGTETDVAKLYPYLNATERNEEAIAQAFAEWDSGKRKVTPRIKELFERIKQFFGRVGNALRGLGFQTAEDVFRRVESGEVGRRSSAEKQPGGGVKEARRPKEPEKSSEQSPTLFSAEIATLPESAKKPKPPSPKAQQVQQALPHTALHVPQHVRQVFSNRAMGRLAQLSSASRISGAWLRYQLQDRYVYLKKLQQQVENRTGGPLPEAVDGYTWLRLFPGKAGHDLVKFDQRYVAPFVERMTKLGLTPGELGLYLYASHAPSRNAKIAAINPQLPDGGSGMTNAEAQNILDVIDNAGLTPKFKELEDAVRKMQRVRLAMLNRHGIIPSKLYHEFLSDPTYIPLRGWQDDVVKDYMLEGQQEPGNRTGRGFDIRHKELQALGRQTRANYGEIIPNILMQIEQSIVVSHKNDATKALLKFIQQNPDPNLWEIDVRKTRLAKNKSTGMVQVIPDQRYRQRENVVGVMVDGEQHYITFHHPYLAPAIKNLGGQELQWMGNALHAMNRSFAFIYTSANPYFVISNMIRDAETAAIHLQEVDRDTLTRDIMKDLVGLRRKGALFYPDLGALRAEFKALRDGSPNGAEQADWMNWFDEYWRSGGKVEFFSLRDIEAQKKRIASAMKDVNPTNLRKMRKYALATIDLVSDVNGAVENNVRFLTYVHLRKRGWSPQKAAMYARNVTVDFNLKGMQGPKISALYLFYNASIQSAARQAQAIMSPGKAGKRIRAVVAAIILSGFMNDLLNGLLLSPDEDDIEGIDFQNGTAKTKKRTVWDTLPEHYKRRYFVLSNPLAEPKPGDSAGFGFFLPYGYNVFYRLGITLGELVRGVTTPTAAAVNMLSTFLDYYNPLGGASNPAMVLVPQIAKAPAEWLINEDWTGKPIMPPEDPYARGERDADRYWGSVSEPAKGIANWLYEGFDEPGVRTKPFVADVSPETLEHFWRAYTGGIGNFVTRNLDALYRFANQEDVKWRDIPFAGQLSISQSASWYYDKYNSIINTVYTYRDNLKKADGDPEKQARIEKANPIEAQLLEEVLGNEKVLKRLNKVEKAIRSDDRLTEKEKDDTLWGTEKDPGPDRQKLAIMRRIIDRWEKLNDLR